MIDINFLKNKRINWLVEYLLALYFMEQAWKKLLSPYAFTLIHFKSIHEQDDKNMLSKFFRNHQTLYK